MEHVQIDIHDILSINDKHVNLKAYLDIRGDNVDHHLRQDRGWVEIVCEKDTPNSAWKITSLSMPEKEILVAKQTLFTDVTKSSGLSTIPLYPN